MVQEFLLRRQRGNVWAPPGFGKTVITYTALDLIYLLGLESRPTLVLGPLRVARDTWSNEVLKWQHLRDIDVSAIVGTPKQRKDALKRDCAVYTTNYENLPWLVEQLGDAWPFGTVVGDESTRLKSFRLTQGGKRAHALSKVAWTHVNRWINLTGTPAPNGLLDLWGQMWFIDQGVRLGRTFTAFKERWFAPKPDGFGTYALPHAQREIESLLKDVAITLDAKDWFDIKDPIKTTVPVYLPAAAMKMYKELEKTMFTELACGTQLEVFNAAALTNKCLQMANGMAYHEGTEKPVHDAKLEALESLVEEINAPVIVAYSFVSDIKRIKKLFGNRCEVISEAKHMTRFKKGELQIGLTHDMSTGHGIDGLQNVCNHLIRFGHTWNLENRMQLAERIGPVRQLQAGLDRPVFEFDICAMGTVDEVVMERHETKAEVQQLLLDAMKRLQ
jgi:hypothetical protein